MAKVLIQMSWRFFRAERSEIEADSAFRLCFSVCIFGHELSNGFKDDSELLIVFFLE